MPDPRGLSAQVRLDPPAARLADPMTLTLSLDGPAPLRVDWRGDGLSASARPLWQLTPLAPARLSELPAGRQRWTQRFRAEPLRPGPALPLELEPLGVQAGNETDFQPVAWPRLSAAVTTSVTPPLSGQLRGGTGVEEPPAEVPPGASAFPTTAILGMFVAACVGWGVLFTLRRWGRRQATPPGDPLALLADPELSDAEFAERLSAAVRRQLGPTLPAALTSDEFAAALPGEVGPEVRGILAACDGAKFAGGTLAAEGRAGLVAAVRRLQEPGA